MSKKEIDIDESFVKSIMANEIPRHLDKITSENIKAKKPEVKEEIEEEDEEKPVRIENSEKETKRKKKIQQQYSDTFFIPQIIPSRKQIYISQQSFDFIIRYIPVIKPRNISLTVFFENVIRHHLETNREEIIDLFKKKINEI